MQKKITIFFIISTLLLAGCSSGPGKYDAFASCLTEKGVVMYSAFWCSHCEKQKKMFDGSFEYINSVECSLPDGNSQTEYCIKKDIKGYPTWELDNGTRLEGIVPLELLSEKMSCQLQ